MAGLLFAERNVSLRRVTGGNHSALQAFLAQIDRELVLAQVLIRRCEPGHELRHAADAERPVKALRELRLTDLRELARFTARGAFRPLKAAPNLPAGWWLRVNNDADLETALNQLYPGSIADWFAAQSSSPPVTHYREFCHRQTGMYRITTLLDDAQAAQVARACCHRHSCLKRRLWSVDGLTPELIEEKSLIPCLEPCAILLEFARQAMRIQQEMKLKLELSPSEAVTLAAALRTALAHPDPTLREADFNAPGNPRRIQLLLEKIQPLAAAGEATAEE